MLSQSANSWVPPADSVARRSPMFFTSHTNNADSGNVGLFGFIMFSVHNNMLFYFCFALASNIFRFARLGVFCHRMFQMFGPTVKCFNLCLTQTSEKFSFVLPTL